LLKNNPCRHTAASGHRAVALDDLEFVGPHAMADPADQRRRRDDQGKRHPTKVDRRERQQRDRRHDLVAQRPAADPKSGRDDNREHRRLESVEHRRNSRQTAPGDIDETESPQEQRRRQHEQRARDHAAPRAMQQPPDVRRELLRFRTGQEHAVIQRVQKPRLADPASLLHQLRVHDRNLPGRPAEADQAELEPEAKRLGPGRLRLRFAGRSGHEQQADKPRNTRNTRK
jgi:hypothetical protein